MCAFNSTPMTPPVCGSTPPSLCSPLARLRPPLPWAPSSPRGHLTRSPSPALPPQPPRPRLGPPT